MASYPYAGDEALSQSIFVKDLPADITAARLAEEFQRFGPLRNGLRGINLKAQKDKATFAFIEFESEASARAAIAAEVSRLSTSAVKHAGCCRCGQCRADLRTPVEVA